MKLIALNNKSWRTIKENRSKVVEFFVYNKRDPIIYELFAISIELIISEFILNPQYYDKYPSKDYSNKDLVNVVIDTIGSSVPPDIDKFEDNEKYIDELRNLIWGYMKMLYTKNSSTFFRIMEKEGKLVKKDMNILENCLIVVWVESFLRNREHIIIESVYV